MRSWRRTLIKKINGQRIWERCLIPISGFYTCMSKCAHTQAYKKYLLSLQTRRCGYINHKPTRCVNISKSQKVLNVWYNVFMLQNTNLLDMQNPLVYFSVLLSVHNNMYCSICLAEKKIINSVMSPIFIEILKGSVKYAKISLQVTWVIMLWRLRSK